MYADISQSAQRTGSYTWMQQGRRGPTLKAFCVPLCPFFTVRAGMVGDKKTCAWIGVGYVCDVSLYWARNRAKLGPCARGTEGRDSVWVSAQVPSFCSPRWIRQQSFKSGSQPPNPLTGNNQSRAGQSRLSSRVETEPHVEHYRVY